MRALLFTLAAATALAFSTLVSAQDAEFYRLERTENGFVRMDVRTGEMSFCEEHTGRLVCKPGAYEEAPEADGLEELKRRIGELEERLATLEARQPHPGAGLPSEEEFERTMTFMERFLRRFWGVAKDLERESNPGEPAPDRT